MERNRCVEDIEKEVTCDMSVMKESEGLKAALQGQSVYGGALRSES